MTSRGRRLAALFAILLAGALPKDSRCRYPGEDCYPDVRGAQLCDRTETQPLGAWAIEWALGRDLGIAYSVSYACQ